MEVKKLFLLSIFLTTFLFAGNDEYYDYAKVTYSQPIYEYVYHDRPQKECRKVRYKINHREEHSYDNSLGLDSLVGVAAGAVIGSQIGKGNGRTASQIVGGLLGGKVAHEIRNNYKSDYNEPRYTYETRTECYDSYKEVRRKELTGYKNFFIYNGVKHYKVTARPIKRVKVFHTISF